MSYATDGTGLPEYVTEQLVDAVTCYGFVAISLVRTFSVPINALGISPRMSYLINCTLCIKPSSNRL